MITRSRFTATCACTLGVALMAARGHAAEQNGGQELAAEVAAFLAAQPKWSVSASLDASYGHRDNLLLSHADEERSAFMRGTAELLLLRVPRGQFDFSFFAQGERTRFLSPAEIDDRLVDHEAKAWAQSDFGYRFGEELKLSLPVTGYYSDQVFDVSETEVQRDVAELQVRGAMIGPMVRWAFWPSWWIEAQATGERKRYEDRVNDGTVGEGAVRLGWIRGERLEARISGAQRWRNFDRRARYSAAGRELAGTQLKIAEREGQLRVDVAWDEAGHFQTSTRASLLHYRDNGSGYFNYREQRIDHEFEWDREPWLVRVGGAVNRIDFGVQTVGFGINATSRLKEEYTVDVRLERKLSARWLVFGAYRWERSRCNDPIASYTVNEGLLGVRWNWEK